MMAHITAWSTYRLKKVHISIDRGRRTSDSETESSGLCTPYAVRKHGRRFRWCWLFIIVPLAALLLIKFLTHDGTHNAYIFLGVFVTVALILVLVCIPLAISTGYKQSPIVEYHVSSTKSTSPDSTSFPTGNDRSSFDNGIESPAQTVLCPASTSDSTVASNSETGDNLKTACLVNSHCDQSNVLPSGPDPLHKDNLETLPGSDTIGEYSGDITDKMLLSS